MLSLLATIGEIQNNIASENSKLLNNESIQSLIYVVIAYCHIGNDLEQLYTED